MTAAVVAVAAPRSDAAALFEHDQHVLDNAVLQRIGQLDAVAIGDVALRIGDGDVAVGENLAGLAVPGDRVGAQPIAAAIHSHVALGGDDVVVEFIFQRPGAELDLIVIGRQRRFGRRRGRDGPVLQILGGSGHRP